MPIDHFGTCIESLVAAIDGSPARIEQALDEIERELMEVGEGERNKRRHYMRRIVAELARIEVRMMKTWQLPTAHPKPR